MLEPTRQRTLASNPLANSRASASAFSRASRIQVLEFDAGVQLNRSPRRKKVGANGGYERAEEEVTNVGFTFTMRDKTAVATLLQSPLALLPLLAAEPRPRRPGAS